MERIRNVNDFESMKFCVSLRSYWAVRTGTGSAEWMEFKFMDLPIRLTALAGYATSQSNFCKDLLIDTLFVLQIYIYPTIDRMGACLISSRNSFLLTPLADADSYMRLTERC